MVASRKPPGLAAAWALFLISFLLMPFMASAASANTSSIATFPSEVEDYVMYLYLSIEQSHGSSTYQYYAAPLTPQVGLGDPNAWRIINVVGSVMPVNAFNYQTFDANHTVAFVSCDWPATSNATANNTNPADPALNSTTPEIILNTVMGKKPTAIVLYSLENPGCSLTGDNLSYTSIWTMAVVEQAKNAIRVSNATNGFVATITGKDMAPGGSGPNGGGGGGAQTAGGSGNSNVAMSILYSITGLITALFLVIITTGAVRAHRNPERYGPRAAVNGRARQSRAKGIARAVLETLPIVKFGDAKPTKSDPEMEIDTLPGDRQQALVTGNEASSSHTRPSTERRVDAQSAADSPNEPPSETAAVPGTATPADNNDNGQVGCSICTEDFKVGEDVRVLPCDHNFHPACIDPWLVNVSGTCPLCRLDLRPAESSNADGTSPPAEGAAPDETSPPESAATGAADSSRTGHRMSRLLHPGRPRGEHVDPLTMVENRQSHISSEGSEHDQRRMERILHLFHIRTRRQEQTPPSS